ncbi:MAG TPA: cupredoxin domain-containing protein [Candidatus Thermoplasmatota archaeon]|nr:cupredoxin domain-containing protein [Candidatus Thermoplasmatota archaeon]
MPRHRTLQPIALLTFAAFVVTPLAVAGFAGAAHVTAHHQRTIEVSLFQYGMDPGVIDVEQGDTVTLVLNATDVAHGFFVDGYEIDVHVVPGSKVSYTFEADKAGHFNIRCSMNCGVFHPYMLGRLEVRENWNFVLAASAAVGLTALALAFSWRGAPDTVPEGAPKT